MAMNDPHVEALHYRLKHSEGVDYAKAKPLEHQEPGFSIRIDNGRADIAMKSHYATAQAARDEVEPFLRAWELSAALKSGPGEIQFDYENASIVDRKPTPGAALQAEAAMIVVSGMQANAIVGRGKYPDPPAGLLCDATVDLMFDRFCRYRTGRTTLADAAYFCLTVLEMNAGGRAAAAQRFSVAATVLGTLGRLAGSKGGKEARKGPGAQSDFSAAERTWLEEAIKLLIRRAAEVAHDPVVSRSQITMAELPSLPSTP